MKIDGFILVEEVGGRMSDKPIIFLPREVDVGGVENIIGAGDKIKVENLTRLNNEGGLEKQFFSREILSTKVMKNNQSFAGKGLVELPERNKLGVSYRNRKDTDGTVDDEGVFGGPNLRISIDKKGLIVGRKGKLVEKRSAGELQLEGERKIAAQAHKR